MISSQKPGIVKASGVLCEVRRIGKNADFCGFLMKLSQPRKQKEQRELKKKEHASGRSTEIIGKNSADLCRKLAGIDKNSTVTTGSR